MIICWSVMFLIQGAECCPQVIFQQRPCSGRKRSPHNVWYTRARNIRLMYISIYTIDVYCIYRALRARSDWVQSTDARISYASTPPLTNCHRPPNSMMFLDSGIKLASHTKTIPKNLKYAAASDGCATVVHTQTQRLNDGETRAGWYVLPRLWGGLEEPVPSSREEPEDQNHNFWVQLTLHWWTSVTADTLWRKNWQYTLSIDFFVLRFWWRWCTYYLGQIDLATQMDLRSSPA